jgi:hypothetical protein
MGDHVAHKLKTKKMTTLQLTKNEMEIIRIALMYHQEGLENHLDDKIVKQSEVNNVIKLRTKIANGTAAKVKKKKSWTIAEIFASAKGLKEGTKEHISYINDYEKKHPDTKTLTK